MEVLTIIAKVKAIRNQGYFADRTYLWKPKRTSMCRGAESFGGFLSEREGNLGPSCFELEL